MYHVQYQKIGHNSELMDQFVEYPMTETVITGLKKGTSYTVTVAINNTAGFSPESDSVDGTTDVDCKYLISFLPIYFML